MRCPETRLSHPICTPLSELDRTTDFQRIGSFVFPLSAHEAHENWRVETSFMEKEIGRGSDAMFLRWMLQGRPGVVDSVGQAVPCVPW